VRVRRATADDTHILRGFWEDSNRELDFTPYAQSAFAAELLTDHIALVAEDAGAIIGCVYAATPGDDHGFAFGLYVFPARRRQGVARALIAATADELKRRGRRFLVLSVDTPNGPARSMYEALGFVDQARILRADVDDLLGHS
jgi:ribosomal protein S18 acetylase RimI-like enzyme